MRKRFGIQYELGVRPIEELDIPLMRRDELPPTLRALQHIYCSPSLNEAVFNLLEKKIMTESSQRTGRLGMSLWEILVLGVVRLCLDTNYDRLEDMANHHKLIRDLLGVETFGDGLKRYPLQTIKDNVCLLDEATIDQISELVVKAGHRIKKNEDLEVKVDSYVLESNVHFPTDLSLLWDSLRKCIALTMAILSDSDVSGWRKHKDWFHCLKSAFRLTNKIVFGGGANKEERVIASTEHYLSLSRSLSKKIDLSQALIARCASGSPGKMLQLSDLYYFKSMLDKHIDLVERRIIYDEKIPHVEKMFSLFEPYTKWINKGKMGDRVELGLRLVVCRDQYGFILTHHVLEKKQDVEWAVPMTDKLLASWNVDSISFDKSFWSKENYEQLKKMVSSLILPKRGKLNKLEYEREHSKTFLSLRRQHAVIESDINSLEHHGLNRCPDKGFSHFKTYASLGILSFNLHRLGNILIEEERNEIEKQLKHRKRKAA